MAGEVGGAPGARGERTGGGVPLPGTAAREVRLDAAGRLPGGADPVAVLVGWVPDRRTRDEILRSIRWMRSGGLAGGRHWFLPGDPAPGILVACRPEFDEKGHLAGMRLLHAAGPEVLPALAGWLRGSEDLVARYARAWRRAETRLKVLFDGSPDLHLLVDRRGRIREVNRAVRETVGWPEEALLGRHPVRFVARGERPRVMSVVRLLQGTGRISDFEVRVRRPDGTELEVSASATLVPGEEGNSRGAHVVLRDVTQRNRLQRRIWQADRLAVTGRIAAGVAHEINNPLQAVLMHLSLLERGLPRDPSTRQAWHRVRKGVERIRGIVSDLLDLHRGSENGRSGPADVNRVAFEALELVQVPVRHQGIRLRVALADDLPPVRISEQHLYQVLLNLLLNAIGAMHEGGQLTLRTRWLAGVREAEIDVADSGPGIPEHLLPHVFEPFHGGEDSAGAGLGLFVTWGLVHRAGGRIHVDSVPGRGTTFRVFLPVVEER